MNKYYYAFTPGGTLCIETQATSYEKCKQNLVSALSHMPYKNWKAIEKRGYTIEALDCDYGELEGEK